MVISQKFFHKCSFRPVIILSALVDTEPASRCRTGSLHCKSYTLTIWPLRKSAPTIHSKKINCWLFID